MPQEVITPLQRTRYWVRLISVMLWISAGIMLLGGSGVGIAVLSGMSAFLQGSGDAGSVGYVVTMAGVYVVMAFLYIYPAIKLWAYGTLISRLVASRDPQDLVMAMNTQRAFWKFMGIMTLVGIAIIILTIIGMLVFVVFAASIAAAK